VVICVHSLFPRAHERGHSEPHTLSLHDALPILACRTAKMMNVEVGVFEEGYMRPDYLTLDEGGVNGHSKIPKNPEFYFNRPRQKIGRDTSELQSRENLVCRLLLEKKKKQTKQVN